MNAHERAAHLYDEAKKLGLDAPTEDMIADALRLAEDNVETDIVYGLKEGGFTKAAKAIANWRELRKSKANE
jgi:cytochrome c-type biogenesis protein CcmH/NrfG